MRPRLLTALATGALTLSLLGPVAAQADDPEFVPGGPSLPEQASEAARQQATDALDEAQALFEEKPRAEARELLADGGLDATMVLNQLVRARPDLSASQRRQADALLARPTDDGGGAVGDRYTVDEEPPVCGDTVCIHYVADTEDAPDMTDGDDANTTPDSVDQALATAESVNDTYEAAGYRRPDGDGARGGGNDLVDVYLSQMGNQGYYGYCATDQRSRTFNRWAYCGIDNDFAEFSRHTPLENQQVTLAHEYFHAVQFAYDYFEDAWVMEATATWAEDEVFDDVDDNRQYLEDSQLKRPRSPLDRWTDNRLKSYQYGNWIFFRYLTERWDAETDTMPTLVLDLWKKLSARTTRAPDMYSTQAVQAVLAARGTGFTPVYGQFADANRRPETTYDEGAAYPTVRPHRTWTLSRSSRNTGEVSRSLDHLTSLPLRYRPDAGLTQDDWRLRLKVDMPARATAPVARVTRYLTGGGVQTSTIRLRKNGTGARTVGFSAGAVDHVELVLVNASRRVSDCWTDNYGDVFACYGSSRDNNRRTDFSARIFRP